MRAVIQRVKNASVAIDGEIKGQCGEGFLILLGVHQNDSEEDAELLARKIAKTRIFCDDEGKMNMSIIDIGGEVLIVSQFTLYADYEKGNRPSYFDSARPEVAIPLYERFISLMKEEIIHVETGEFGADMQVSLINDGPVTIIMDSEKLRKI